MKSVEDRPQQQSPSAPNTTSQVLLNKMSDKILLLLFVLNRPLGSGYRLGPPTMLHCF